MKGVKMVGFRHITQDQPKLQFKRYSLEESSLVVVLLEFSGNQQEKQIMNEVEEWVKKQASIRLVKITRRDAFVQTYMDLMAQPEPVVFVSGISVDKLEEEPLLIAYQQKLCEEGRLEEVLGAARENIERVHFIILKESIEDLKRLNFYHPGVSLITDKPELVEKEINKLIGKSHMLSAISSSSSINSEEVQKFEEKMQQKIGEGVNIISPTKVQEEEEEREVWRAKSQTPGVGSYNLAVEVKTEGVKISPSRSRSHQMEEWQKSNCNPGPGTYN